MSYYAIVTAMALTLSSAYAGHKGKEPQYIEFGVLPPWVDVKLRLSNGEDSGEGGGAVKVGRKDSNKESAEHPGAAAANTRQQIEEDTKQNEPVDTSPYRTFIRCNGVDGWLTTQVNKQTQQAVSAKFSPTFDPEGNAGSNVSMQFTGEKGSQPVTQNLLKSIALGDAKGKLGNCEVGPTAGGPVEQGC